MKHGTGSRGRRPTREVRVGDVGIGGANPIRIQSMTTTDTRDVAATAAQVEGLVDAGCEIVRVTAPSRRDAEALAELRAALARRGVRVPLVADIHFTPRAAMLAVEHVEKVRINPGNYADRKRFEVREYSDAQYAAELERVAERFRPLVRRARELGRALRIGANHGSLSDRVMNRYGDTDAGMVESALEFLDVCEDEGFADVVFSMKSSDPRVAIRAYRLLAARLEERAPGGPGLPFHLGVTEAGDGEDGRLKSAIGIGALLDEGIGDTVRVSLTEDPVREVPVARALAQRAEARGRGAPRPWRPHRTHGDIERRRTRALGALGGAQPVRVEVELGAVAADPEAQAREVARALARVDPLECEGLLVDVEMTGEASRAGALAAALSRLGVEAPLAIRVPLGVVADARPGAGRRVVRVPATAHPDQLAAALKDAATAGAGLEWSLEAPAALDAVRAVAEAVPDPHFAVSIDGDATPSDARALARALADAGLGNAPVVLRRVAPAGLDAETAALHAAWDLGTTLCEGVGDAVALGGFGDPGRCVDLGYRILQAARVRTTRSEFIACPSCGRTLFDLEPTTASIRARLEHLSGVKIAIMGCIVNGLGEMADADFGYVGSGPGLVNLYVGKQLVARHVPTAAAEEQLVDLIREHGRWVDPPEAAEEASP